MQVGIGKKAFGGAVLAIALGGAPAAYAQFRAPKIPKIELPTAAKDKSSDGTFASSSASSSTEASSGANPASPAQKKEFNDLIRKLERTINPNTTVRTLKADGERVDRDVAAYRANADKLSSGEFDGLIEQRPNSLSRLKRNYDSLSKRVDREVQFASNMVKGHGVAEAGYNYLLTIDATLYGAEKLFPGNAEYSDARSKVTREMAKYGSRAGAAAAEEEAELAAARKVQMPRATVRDPKTERQFRSAYRSAGLPYSILKVHIAGGWQTYTEYGRVVGRTRDAYIAAKDPNSNRCNLYYFTMLVDNGGNARRKGHTTKRIACENVK